jgi:hypothetical protein
LPPVFVLNIGKNMAQFLYKKVKPTGQGGDYTSLESCLAANEQDLTGHGWFDIEIDGDWSGVADTTAASIDVYVTTTNDYINIYTTSTARHKGVYSSSYYRLEVDNPYGSVLSVSVANVNIIGLQVKNTRIYGNETDVSFYPRGLLKYNSVANLWVDSCIVLANDLAIESRDYGGFMLVTNTISKSIQSNAFDGFGSGNFHISGCIGISFKSTAMTGPSATYRSCYGYSRDSTAYASFGSITDCASDDATGSTGLQNVAYDTASGAYFTNVTANSEDFHITNTSSSLFRKGNGGGRFSNYTTKDMDGDTRTWWDIGVDYIVGSGPTTVKKTVTPAGQGGDFNTLNSAVAWFVTNYPNFVTSNIYGVIEIDGNWTGVVDSTAVSLSGITTSSNNYLHIYTTAAARHPGYWDSTKYSVQVSADASSIFYFNLSFVTVDGLQLRNTHPTNPFSASTCVSTSEEYTQGMRILKNCLCYAPANTIYIQYNTWFTCINNVFISRDGIAMRAYGQAAYFFNCIGVHTGSQSVNAAVDSSGYYTRFQNCYAANPNSATAAWGNNGGLTLTACASNDGSQSTTTVAYDTASGAYFTNIGTGTEDYHIKSSSGLKDIGKNLSNIFSVDIDGQTRVIPWDIGVDELIITRKYTKDALASLPSDAALPSIEFAATEYTNVETDDDSTYADQAGTGTEYMVQMYLKQSSIGKVPCIITWDGKCTLAPSSKTVYLQVYNRTDTTWETLDSNSVADANTEFALTGLVTGANINKYYDGSDKIVYRVYQQAS